MPTWFVEPLKSRPPFLSIITFLWKKGHNVDSDGDSYPRDSTDWTWLYLQNRERPEEIVNVNVDDDVPDRFSVKSDLPWLAAATAYVLAVGASARVRATDSDRWLEPRELEAHLGPFDLAAACNRLQLVRP